ncbi:Bacteriophage P22, Gp10, DNA-stabilising [uncultured Caudovirales phage]|uniref:Bacteriophage P22, Gp10, DNA-stabilising n=1 Tax=uncultured Caudovirales phage TaxID=2100421 RepID=A0A6J5N4V1_9CAUD|nr:Bacteriophage P22, Gp10, DNA-stabilising [uncultured Caudovirales phage]
MRFKGFIGPAYTLKSVNVDAQRCVNLYPEINEMNNGKAAEIAWLRSTPGLEKVLEIGTGPIRLVHFDDTPTSTFGPDKRFFVASGSQMFMVTNVLGVWTSTLLGDLQTSTGVIKASSIALGVGIDDTPITAITVFVDGTYSYAFVGEDFGGPPVTGYGYYFSEFSTLGYSSVGGATHVVNIDGYFIYVNGTNRFFVSDLNSLVVDPLSFASSEGSADNIVAAISNTRDLWLFNEKTTEVFVNTGNSDFPFERVQGGFIEKGCVAGYSVAKIDGVVFWLGRDESGEGIVYAAQGLSPQRISTHAIESEISTYANISSSSGYTYQKDGHSFYVLNFDEATWVYDLTTKLWHERAFTSSGVLERHRANNHAFVPEYGIHFVGDYESNKLYKLNEDYYLDDTDYITRLRSSPHVSNELKQIFCKSFQLDIEAGVGLDGTTQGTDPQIMFQYSDDGGHTWSSELTASMGKIGEYKKRAIWRRLGTFRDRVFQVKITDPVKVALIGAELDAEGGSN